MRIITRLNVGGPAYQAIYLTQRMQGVEISSRLLTGDVGPNEGSMEPLAAERGVEFTRVDGLGREISLKSDGLTVGRIYREIRRFKPHLVHTHLAKAGAVGRIAARLARVPKVVHTYHGHVFHGYFSARKTKAFVAIERSLARRTDSIIVLSEEQRDEILGYGVGRPEQFEVVPLGLELEPFLNAEQCWGALRTELGIEPNAPIVGIVARLVPIKAHDLFLKAARKLVDRMPHARFVVVGDGDLRSNLEDLAREIGFTVVSHEKPGAATASSPKRSVHFLGFRSDLARIYADLDLVVVCSHNEGMPVAIIEALASARPVVATDVGAVRRLVLAGETGLLTTPGSVEELASAMEAQLTDRRKADLMGRAGRSHVYPSLSIDRLETDLRKLYHQLAGTSSAATPVALVGTSR